MRDTHIDTDWWEGFLNYPVKMGSRAMIYMLRDSKVDREDTQSHRQDGDRIKLL
jgi:hypothetical protein